MSCSNCKQPFQDHCAVHIIPCCPGKCPGRRYADRCQICELPIEKTDRTKHVGEGLAHRICFDISVAGLAEDIEAALSSQPDKYEEIKPGVFKTKGK